MRITSRTLGVALLIILVVACFVGFKIFAHIYRSGYPIPPPQFYAQADKILPGMTKEEVLALPIICSKRKWVDEHRLVFSMKLKADAWFSGPTCYISVEFGQNGCVTSVKTYDG